jgi:hypothetical protein
MYLLQSCGTPEESLEAQRLEIKGAMNVEINYLETIMVNL